MDDIYLYLIPMPGAVTEAITPCLGGYTVYINANLTRRQQLDAYEHAMRHIKRGDFERTDVGRIETEAHKKST